MTSYNPNVPTGSVNLNLDWRNLQANFQQLNTQFGTDHIPLSATMLNGYHTDIHFNPFSTTSTNPPNNYVSSTAGTSTQYPATAGLPPTVSGIGQIWSAQVNDSIGSADTGLYWLSGNGLQVALTRNFQPAATIASGFTFLPGGFMLQWGRTSITANTTGPLTFPKPFPNAFLNLQTTVTSNSVVPANTSITIFGRTDPNLSNTTSVNIQNTTSSTVAFFWTAIGY